MPVIVSVLVAVPRCLGFIVPQGAVTLRQSYGFGVELGIAAPGSRCSGTAGGSWPFVTVVRQAEDDLIPVVSGLVQVVVHGPSDVVGAPACKGRDGTCNGTAAPVVGITHNHQTITGVGQSVVVEGVGPVHRRSCHGHLGCRVCFVEGCR